MRNRERSNAETRHLIVHQLRAVEDLLATGTLTPSERAAAEQERDSYAEMLESIPA